jgi:hypothetical protein
VRDVDYGVRGVRDGWFGDGAELDCPRAHPLRGSHFVGGMGLVERACHRSVLSVEVSRSMGWFTWGLRSSFCGLNVDSGRYRRESMYPTCTCLI